MRTATTTTAATMRTRLRSPLRPAGAPWPGAASWLPVASWLADASRPACASWSATIGLGGNADGRDEDTAGEGRAATRQEASLGAMERDGEVGPDDRFRGLSR